jgi:acetoacetate decarboxylase
MRRYGVTRPSEHDIRQSGFSTPWDAPMIPPFPFEFRNVEILTLYWRTDPEAMAFLLPPPLEPVGDVACVHIYRMNDTDWLGPYSEANVMFGARLGDRVGAYSPYLVLSSDIGVAHGREVHGQPKKLGQPRLEVRGDLVVGAVERNGIDVITGTTPYKQRRIGAEGLKPHFDFATNLNLKAVDHIDGRPAIRQLTSRKLANVKVHEAWTGPATVELRPNAQLPVFRLPVSRAARGDPLAGGFHARPGRDHSRLSGGRCMSLKVVVTDYTFPSLAAEEAAARAAGAAFSAHQCRTDAEVAEAVAGADAVAVQFAPSGRCRRRRSGLARPSSATAWDTTTSTAPQPARPGSRWATCPTTAPTRWPTTRPRRSCASCGSSCRSTLRSAPATGPPCGLRGR